MAKQAQNRYQIKTLISQAKQTVQLELKMKQLQMKELKIQQHLLLLKTSNPIVMLRNLRLLLYKVAYVIVLDRLKSAKVTFLHP